MPREVTFRLKSRKEGHRSSRWVQGTISLDAVIRWGSLFWVPLTQSHTLAGTGGHRESHWQSKPPSIRHKHVCTRTHKTLYIQRDSPLQTPTDTQPHPSISMRMTGREPRVGGDAQGLTVTQPHAMKHSPDHHHPTHRNTWNSQTCVSRVSVITPPPPTKRRNMQ